MLWGQQLCVGNDEGSYSFSDYWALDESIINIFNRLFESILFRFYMFLFPL